MAGLNPTFFCMRRSQKDDDLCNRCKKPIFTDSYRLLNELYCKDCYDTMIDGFGSPLIDNYE